jgi:hypothetical protein
MMKIAVFKNCSNAKPVGLAAAERTCLLRKYWTHGFEQKL